MEDFNGIYDQLPKGQEKLSKAHIEALELLGIVHQICRGEKLLYSLADQALLGYLEEIPFENLPPGISVIMKHRDVCILRERLARFTDEHREYLLVDYKNSPQFDSFVLWFAKRNRVRLPEERRKDEVYYDTHISIVPVFDAGNNRISYTMAVRTYLNAIRALHARAPLPQRLMMSRLRSCRKTLFSRWYRRKRKQSLLEETERRLTECCEQSSFCFFSINEREESIIMLYAKELEEVEEITFAGQTCWISRYAENIGARYPGNYKEAVRKRRVSDLIREGGENLRRVQLIQTEMLEEFDRVCRKNDIRYTIAFGTLLGAVRHKGFIPWDDDVDVIVPIDDYLRLDEAMERDLDTSRFFWRTIDTEVDFNLTFKHLKRNGTVYMKPGREKFKFHKGVLIDVFPVFHSANNRLFHWIQTRLCFFFRTAAWAYMGADSEKKRWKRFLYRCMGKPGPRKNLDCFMKCATMFKKKNPYYSYYNASFRSPYHVDSYLSEDAFDSRIELEFEGHKFWAPRD